MGLGLCNWPNAHRVWSNAHIDQMRLKANLLFSNFTENLHLQFEAKKEYVEILSNVDLHVERSIRIILRITLTLFSGHLLQTVALLC